jgi:hypothetical protein
MALDSGDMPYVITYDHINAQIVYAAWVEDTSPETPASSPAHWGRYSRRVRRL